MAENNSHSASRDASTPTTRDRRATAETESTATTRRSLLAATGATVAGAAGLSATTTTATAAPWDIDVIEIDEGLFGWSADGSLPVADELFVFIHGWFGDSTARSQADDVLQSIQSGGFSPDESVALEWPASTANYFGAEADTEDVGEVAAELAEEFYDDGGGNIRLVGHSLGGRCVLWTADKLSAGYELETVAPLGAAADGSEVCGSPWNDGLDNACEVRNYHSENDSTVGGAYGGFGDTALGTEGAGCSPAANYTDIDVTASVGSHLAYLGDSAVGSDLADAILSGSCDGTDDDDDSDDDDGGWW
ncbi:lipase family protein [Natrialba asiatica]|uniref:Alpha/beta hydrolase n=1 Tax=Natrialba asiatica (strain ATCC 700177 / DSM 12278 / JCM 9576 / FERM P-10747 / NBRC 102637 / 172P1) TaxID=29540 RepID=M0AUR3_NATA1|nr:alpha/beta hydrolase [Natrialba asiatica]ELZ02446.1 hypothetical protein C481_07246 [Natrialba asiatica DSM 12278]